MAEFRKLFIANTTKHNYDFCYRLPNKEKMFVDQIRVGSQAQIYKEAPIDELEYIIKQHQNTPLPFLIGADELSRHKGHIGLIYQFDKPVNVNQIERKFRENEDALVEKGREIREENILALANKLDNTMAETNNGQVGNVIAEVIEEVKPGENANNPIAESIGVERRAGRPRKAR